MSKKLTKRLSSKGGLTIPSNLRAKYGYLDKGFVSIIENEDGSLVIKPTQRGCFFCEEPTDIIYMGTAICKSCAEKVSKLLPEEIKTASKAKKAVTKKKVEPKKAEEVAIKEIEHKPVQEELSLDVVETKAPTKKTPRKKAATKKK